MSDVPDLLGREDQKHDDDEEQYDLLHVADSMGSNRDVHPRILLAEVDGNRTRRTGIARPTRFEGGGAHQALGHLR